MVHDGSRPRASREPVRRAGRRPRQGLLLLLALLAALVVAPSAASAPTPPDAPTPAGAAAQIADTGWVGSVVGHHVTRATHSPTVQRSGGAAVAAGAVLLAALVAGCSRRQRRGAASTRSMPALPRRRGPPNFAFLR